MKLSYPHLADRTNAPAHLGSHCGLHIFLRLRRPPGARRKSTRPAGRSTGAAGGSKGAGELDVTNSPTLTARRGPAFLKFEIALRTVVDEKSVWPKLSTDMFEILLLQRRKNSAGRGGEDPRSRSEAQGTGSPKRASVGKPWFSWFTERTNGTRKNSAAKARNGACRAKGSAGRARGGLAAS